MKKIIYPILLISISFQPTFATELNQSQLSCLLEPSRSIDVSSQVPGIVKSVNAKRGGTVKKGQQLLVLENGLEEAELESVKAKAEFAVRKLERNRDLLSKGLLSDFERDELLTEQKLAAMAVLESKEKLKRRTILSPIDGIVVKRNVSIGEYVGTEPVLELAALNPLNAEVIIEGRSYGKVEIGMQVTIIAAGQTIIGVVDIVDQVIDAASGTFGVRITVPNAGMALPAGLACDVQFPAADAKTL
tara:strand:+ start:1031 stop:1768 length:738 start_codon:yes stop_codon:yes gene_type:complete